MTNIKDKFRRLSYRAKTTYFTAQNLILITALFLCAVWAVSAISTLSKNWESQRAVEAARLEKSRLELEVEMAKLNQSYYRSAEYQELVARTTLNKASAGETLVILPKNSARARNKYQDSAPINSDPPSNFSEWLRFLFK